MARGRGGPKEGTAKRFARAGCEEVISLDEEPDQEVKHRMREFETSPAGLTPVKPQTPNPKPQTLNPKYVWCGFRFSGWVWCLGLNI